MEITLYCYQARVTDVYDGDTCTVDIDLGLNTWMHGEKLRLARINAPEMRGAEKSAGEKSRDFLRKLILQREIVIKTIADKKEKYGRYLAEIWLLDEQAKWINVNDLMVAEGMAEYKEYA